MDVARWGAVADAAGGVLRFELVRQGFVLGRSPFGLGFEFGIRLDRSFDNVLSKF